MKQLVGSGIAAVLLSAVAGVSFAAPVVIQQVEAGENNNPATYAPVNFNGSSTFTSGSITYHAMSATANSTLSGHAQTVASRLATYGGSYFTVDYIQEANNYLSDKGTSYLPGGTNGYGYASVPSLPPTGVRIQNHSWVGDFGVNNYAANARIVRTMEYVANRDDLLMVTAAVTDVVVNAVHTSNQSLAWSQRNGLAVVGAQSSSQWFVPTISTASSTAGHVLNSSDIQRKHADLWGPVSEAASFTTPQVAGIAAQVIGKATDAGQTNATHHQVVKSILMTAANAAPATGFFSSYTPALPNNLDPLSGAGRADASKSYSILAADEKNFANITQGTKITAPTVATSTMGWGYLTSLSGSNSSCIVLDANQGITNLSATLAWDVVPGTSSGRIDGGADQMANLDLALYHVDFSAAGSKYTLGSAVDPADAQGLWSASTNDNVEHLYFTGTLGAGYYAFVVANAGALTGTSAGFSYQFTTVPEPTSILLISAVGLGGLLRRRCRC